MEQIDERLLRWAERLDKRFDTFNENNMCYINVPCCHSREEELFVQDILIKHGAMTLEQMEVGKTYIGCCRNAGEAEWQGDHFVYLRTKWGSTFPEKINHFQNDNGYDVFVPVKVKE
jgi:hypothetical protein